jgi:hypothetical protein
MRGRFPRRRRFRKFEQPALFEFLAPRPGENFTFSIAMDELAKPLLNGNRESSQFNADGAVRPVVAVRVCAYKRSDKEWQFDQRRWGKSFGKSNDVVRLRSIDWCDRSEMLRYLPAVATLPAIAFLVVVHGTVLSGLAAIRLVRRKRYRANRCDQNRKENFRVIFHSITLVRDVTRR